MGILFGIGKKLNVFISKRSKDCIAELVMDFMSAGPTGLEPATSRVTGECSNQVELRPHKSDLHGGADGT
jgi:hypothetical protein